MRELRSRWKSWDPPAWVIGVAASWLFYACALMLLTLSVGTPWMY